MVLYYYLYYIIIFVYNKYVSVTRNFQAKKYKSHLHMHLNGLGALSYALFQRIIHIDVLATYSLARVRNSTDLQLCFIIIGSSVHLSNYVSNIQQ